MCVCVCVCECKCVCVCVCVSVCYSEINMLACFRANLIAGRQNEKRDFPN